ncbi:MAG: TetR/AcrR family transcriptional regulator [Anaerolineae bacterium]|nr:TetR/AcrR family transcriptional regulator [Anaerolineae bacterium]
METKQQIIAIASELFINNGYERTSLTDIAKQIGITKPAIYYHFESKEALFLAVVNNFLTELEIWTLTAIEADVSIKDMLQMLFHMLKNTKGAMALLTGASSSNELEFHTYMLMFEGIKLFPEVKERIDAFYIRFINSLAERIVDAQAQGEIRPDIYADALAFQITAAIEGAFLMSILSPSISLETVSQKMFENIWIGIAN